MDEHSKLDGEAQMGAAIIGGPKGIAYDSGSPGHHLHATANQYGDCLKRRRPGESKSKGRAIFKTDRDVDGARRMGSAS